MKLFKSLPTQNGTAFFDRYANLIHTLTKFGVIAQFITGLAEIGIIYSLIYPSINDLFPSVAYHVAITGSLLAASILQVGLKLVFPYSVRAVLFRRFIGLDLALSIAIFLLTIALLSVSVLLSYKGSQDIIETAIAPPAEKTTAAADSLRATAEQTANAIFKTDSATIETKYKGKLEATESSYDNQIANVEKWSKGKRAVSLRAEKVTKLATLQSDKAIEIETKATERKAAINRAMDRNDSEVKAITTDNSEAKAASEKRKGKYKNYVGFFTFFCYVFFLLAFVLDEIYKKGAGIEEKPIPHQRHFSASLFSELSEAVKARIDTFFRTRIYKFSNNTKASPLPVALDSLYDYKADALKNVHSIESEPTEAKVITLPTKPLRATGKLKDDTPKKDDTEPKKSRQIGFNVDEKETVENAKTAADITAAVYLEKPQPKMKNCEWCNAQFEYVVYNKKYCCDDCKQQAWTAKSGKKFNIELKKKERLKKK